MTVGCFIIVVAAAIAPFVQQVIAIEMRPVRSSDPSSIQVCNSSTYADYGEGAGPGLNKVPLSTTGAIYTGIFESQSPNSDSITMDCPTGNCTFAPYQSLGFCSRCANITDALDLNVTGFSMSSQEYDYTLPNGWNFTTSMSMQYLMNATSSKNLVDLDPQTWPLITNFTAISAAGYGVPPQISATECTLYFCVRTYEASVKNGKFSENLTATDGSSNYTPTNPTGNIALTPNTCYWNGTQYHPPYRGNDGSDHCTYNVTWLSRLAMANSLRPLLKGKGSLFISNRPDWSSETAAGDLRSTRELQRDQLSIRRAGVVADDPRPQQSVRCPGPGHDVDGRVIRACAVGVDGAAHCPGGVHTDILRGDDLEYAAPVYLEVVATSAVVFEPECGDHGDGYRGASGVEQDGEGVPADQGQVGDDGGWSAIEGLALIPSKFYNVIFVCTISNQCRISTLRVSGNAVARVW